MNKATPIPDSIEVRPGGLEKATCRHEGGQIFRTINTWDGRGLPWIHTATKLITCGEKAP